MSGPAFASTNTRTAASSSTTAPAASLPSEQTAPPNQRRTTPWPLEQNRKTGHFACYLHRTLSAALNRLLGWRRRSNNGQHGVDQPRLQNSLYLEGRFLDQPQGDGKIFGDNWKIGFNFLYQLTQNTYSLRDLRLTPNGLLPDGRQRYIGDNNTTPLLDRSATVPGDTGFDLQFINATRGNARAFTWTVAKDYPWVDLTFSYSRQDANSVIDGQVGGTTGQSQYSGTAVLDPNAFENATSSQEVKNSLKYEFSFHKKFFKDLETRLTLFGERRSGRPYSFTLSDQSATGNTQRSIVFGALGSARFLAYVPNFAADTNPNDLQVGPVFFDNATTLNQIRDFVTNGPLAPYQGQIAPRNAFRSPAVNRLDLNFRQELPWFLGHKPEVFVNIENLLNLMNHNWGVVEEFGSQTRLANVACASSTGAVAAANVAATSPINLACTNYQYSGANFNANPNNTDADTPAISLNSTRWTAAIGIRYKF